MSRFVDRNFHFFFNDTATTEIYTLSLHDALPICGRPAEKARRTSAAVRGRLSGGWFERRRFERRGEGDVVAPIQAAGWPGEGRFTDDFASMIRARRKELGRTQGQVAAQIRIEEG